MSASSEEKGAHYSNRVGRSNYFKAKTEGFGITSFFFNTLKCTPMLSSDPSSLQYLQESSF